MHTHTHTNACSSVRPITDPADPVTLLILQAGTFTDKFVDRAVVSAVRVMGKEETNRAVGDSSGSYCISDSLRTRREEERKREVEALTTTVKSFTAEALGSCSGKLI